MKLTQHTAELATYVQQRNLFLSLSAALLAWALSLTGLCWYAFSHARTILVPPMIMRPMLVSSNSVSNSYLVAMTNFLVGLKLNVTPSSAAYQADTLLRYLAPNDYDAFKTALAKEQAELISQDISSVFYPVAITTDTKTLQAVITGDLALSIGNTHLPVKRVRYQLSYLLSGGQLLIKEFKDA